jgi:NADPH-dependent 2,4-dienoyl-CoA reductase/sulfur reductase-like enzyme
MHLVMIGGSDAGISAALRARELGPAADVTVIAADAYPNFSICGIPYYVSGEVTHWRNLAHRTPMRSSALSRGSPLVSVPVSGQAAADA